MSQKPPSELVYYCAPESDPPDSWWCRYRAAITGLSDTALSALEADSRYIVDRALFEASSPSQDGSLRKARTGLVMGSVQSGKTASMFGVTAMAIDKGVDIVVVLAGTRLSLWRQTYDRLCRELDGGSHSAGSRAGRLLVPDHGTVMSADSLNLQTAYAIAPAAFRRRLKRGRPLIVVAMKQTDHLHALAESLRVNVFPNIKELRRGVRMLVLDDEADDGSVLDALVEASQDPIFGNLKQIPRSIANLWDPPQGSPENLFTTYVGYTATPQANLLQEDHNPLAPRDFLVCLRTPLDVGQPVHVKDIDAPRSSTYPEPAGLPAFYTGGEVFYRRGRSAGLCRPLTSDPDKDRAEAVRAFLVAAAIRLARSERVGPATAPTMVFSSEAEAESMVMAPSSMLYHPSASIQDHFKAAEELLIWAGVPDRAKACEILGEGSATLPDTLAAELLADPLPWAAWLDRYKASAAAIEDEFNVLNPHDFPEWHIVRDLLVHEIIPGTRVSVVNSDPSADDRPSYEATQDPETGQWRAPRDICTIFISGNVMARGLTLEGMTTALFPRSSNSPLADTQMQMQRWFGYRGSYIELCRVFASEDQLSLFSAYHDQDESLRTAIIERMVGDAPDPAVLQGLDFLATGKIANVRTFPISPGARPFVTVLNGGAGPDPNAELVAEIFDSTPSSPLVVGNRLRGQILDDPLSLIEAADWLDRLRYDKYKPGVKSALATHWDQIETRVAAVKPLPKPGLYRPPLDRWGGDPTRLSCPYSIAAYLRLWDAALTRRVRGLFVTGEPGKLWSMADLSKKRAMQPRFWVGVRFGEGRNIDTGPLADLSFEISATRKDVGPTGELTTTWGASDPNAGPSQYRSDLFFDYYHPRHGQPVPHELNDSTWRPAGSDGQILIYVNQLDDQTNPAIAVGVCIPAGGPEQFAATRATALLY